MSGARKTILITGANRGVGLAAASRLAAQGHQLVLACRCNEKGTAAAARIASAHPAAPKPHVIPFNLTDVDVIKGSLYHLERALGDDKLDVVVHNAAATATPGALQRPDELKHVLDSNYFGTTHGYFAYHPLLRPGTGRHVFVSSSKALATEISFQYLHDTMTHEALSVIALDAAMDTYRLACATEGSSAVAATAGWPPCPTTVSKIAVAAFARIVASEDYTLRMRTMFGLKPQEFEQKVLIGNAGITANICCPGWCDTEYGRVNIQGFTAPDGKPQSAHDGAAVVEWLATSDEAAKANKLFFAAPGRTVDWVGTHRRKSYEKHYSWMMAERKVRLSDCGFDSTAFSGTSPRQGGRGEAPRLRSGKRR